MKIPFSKKEIVVREIEVKDEAEMTEEEKEEKKVKEAKKGLIGKILLTGASFAGGVAAGVAGYKQYMNKENDSDYIEVKTNDPEVARAAFEEFITGDDKKDETEEN